MPNDLTGDFDVVAEFAVQSVNRLLAAMHRSERFLHSIAIRVDDTPPPDPKGSRPTIMGIVDTFGDPPADHTKVGTPFPVPGSLVAGDPIYSALDPLVNIDVVSATAVPLVPSHLKGRAQLQLSPPTVEITDGSGTNVTVLMRVMSRYFPDPHTRPLAEFVRADVRITAPVSLITSQVAKVVNIDIKAVSVTINFNPTRSNQPLSADDVAMVNLAIGNALKTSFLPSNTTLPPTLDYAQFKTLLGAQHAIALMLNMARFDPGTGQPLNPGNPGNPASLNNNFLGPGDGFAFAAGGDFVLAAFQPVLEHLKNQAFFYQKNILRNTIHIRYAFTLNSAIATLQVGKIILTLKGHAHNSGTGWLPDFDFRVEQALGLNVTGATAELDVGAISLDFTTPGLGGWVVNQVLNLFKGAALDAIKVARDNALTATRARDKVRDMLSADQNLGQFLGSLVKPARQKPGLHFDMFLSREQAQVQLAYTSVEIRPSGIVLHGSLAVPDWPPAHVEFEQIPATADGGIVVAPSDVLTKGPDYSALKTWIPGGMIQEYEWRSQGQAQPGSVDDYRFVLIHPGPEISSGEVSTRPVPGFIPLCLTVRGTRVSSSGPAVGQPVSATVCGYSVISVIPVGAASSLDAGLPLVALTRPGPGGLVEVTGHASARLDGTGRDAPNLIVHFGDENTAGQLELLMQALRESGRRDAPTAILAVLAPDELARARHTDGIIYGENQDGAWERVFGVKVRRPPVTLITAPNGKVVWQHEGELDREALAASLHELLSSRASVRPRMLRSSLRIGRLAPNFLFEHAPGRELALRKLGPAILVFWRTVSKASLETVRDLQRSTGQAGRPRSVVLAVNDGERPELARRVAAENGLSVTVVTDPERRVSLAYGVSIWPTIVCLDASGLVREVRYGRLVGADVEPLFTQHTAASRK